MLRAAKRERGAQRSEGSPSSVAASSSSRPPGPSRGRRQRRRGPACVPCVRAPARRASRAVVAGFASISARLLLHRQPQSLWPPCRRQRRPWSSNRLRRTVRDGSSPAGRTAQVAQAAARLLNGASRLHFAPQERRLAAAQRRIVRRWLWRRARRSPRWPVRALPGAHGERTPRQRTVHLS